MKTILITGGAGFIGSRMVKYIFDNYDYNIIVLDALTYAGNVGNIPDNIKKDKRFTFWHGNIRSGDLVNELVAKSDIVINFAAETHTARSIYDNMLFYETDVLGTQVVTNAVSKHPVERFIHISTSEVYGTALSIPMTEDHQLNPTTPYASAKVGGDRLVYSYWATYDIPVIIVRPFNQFGPNQHLEKVIPRFITSALQDEPLTIHGTGNYTRDWTYVDDTCLALDRVIHADLSKVKGQVINIGTGKDISVQAIAYIVLDELNKPRSLIQHVSGRPGQVNQHISSTDKALRLLGWKAETTFYEGIVKTIKWYRENTDWWKGLLWMKQVPTKDRDGKVEYY